MKFAYVLTTGKTLKYAKMAYVSVATVRRHHPESTLVLLTDEQTQAALAASPLRLLEMFDEVTAVEGLTEDARLRSRFLKTSMRRHVDGDFVFLDVDTILVKPLDGLEAWRADIAAVPEWNGLDARRFPPKAIPLYEELGWRHPVSTYFNSGVIVFRDTPGAHRLGEEWHRRWKLTMERGVVTDQQSLNSAINETDVVADVLPNEFNSMVLFYPWLFRTSRVAHFFESNNVGHTVFSQLVDGVEQTGKINWPAYEYSVVNGHPWGPNPAAWQLWRSANYMGAVKRKIAGLIGGQGRHKLTPTI